MATAQLNYIFWPVWQSTDTHKSTHRKPNNFQFHRLWFGKAKLANNPKSVLSRPPHPPKVKADKNQSFQDHHTIPIYKWSKSSNFKTVTSSQSGNYPESVLSVPPYHPKVEMYWQSVLSRLPHPPKLNTVRNQALQSQHTHSKTFVS